MKDMAAGGIPANEPVAPNPLSQAHKSSARCEVATNFGRDRVEQPAQSVRRSNENRPAFQLA